MSQDLRSNGRPIHLAPAGPSRTPLLARVWMAFLSLAVSSTILGGMLGLFEMHAEDAVIARSAVKGNPHATEIAVRTARATARG